MKGKIVPLMFVISDWKNLLMQPSVVYDEIRLINFISYLKYILGEKSARMKCSLLHFYQTSIHLPGRRLSCKDGMHIATYLRW